MSTARPLFLLQLAFADEARRGLLVLDSRRVEVALDSVVGMVRIKKTLWDRLDGNLNAGIDFTQQNSKLDLNLSSMVKYNVSHHHLTLDFAGTFSRQDSVSDIERRALTAVYAREIRERWFWAGAGDAVTNSQLSLDYSWSIGTGPGRFLVLSDRVSLTTWLGAFYRRERYEGDEAGEKLPLSLTTNLEWFAWAGLSTDLSSRLVVSPILTTPAAGRSSSGRQ